MFCVSASCSPPAPRRKCSVETSQSLQMEASLRTSSNPVTCKNTVLSHTPHLLPFPKGSPSHQQVRNISTIEHNLRGKVGTPCQSPSPRKTLWARTIWQEGPFLVCALQQPCTLCTQGSHVTSHVSPSQRSTTDHVLSRGVLQWPEERAINGEELAGEGHKLSRVQGGPQPLQTLNCCGGVFIRNKSY